MAVEGCVARDVDYRAMLSYRQAWGSGYIPRVAKVHDFSAMVEASWLVPTVKGLSLKGSAAVDRGDIFGNNFGVSLTLSYNGEFTLWKR